MRHVVLLGLTLLQVPSERFSVRALTEAPENTPVAMRPHTRVRIIFAIRQAAGSWGVERWEGSMRMSFLTPRLRRVL